MRSFHLIIEDAYKIALYKYLIGKYPLISIYFEQIERILKDLDPRTVFNLENKQLCENLDLLKALQNAPYSLLIFILYYRYDLKYNFFDAIKNIFKHDCTILIKSIDEFYICILILFEMFLNSQIEILLKRINVDSGLDQLFKIFSCQEINLNYFNKFSADKYDFYYRLCFIYEQTNFLSRRLKIFDLKYLCSYIVSYSDSLLLREGDLISQSNILLNKYDSLRPLIVLKNKLQWEFISAVIRASFLKKHFGNFI